jgi:hypothetical protein
LIFPTRAIRRLFLIIRLLLLSICPIILTRRCRQGLVLSIRSWLGPIFSGDIFRASVSPALTIFFAITFAATAVHLAALSLPLLFLPLPQFFLAPLPLLLLLVLIVAPFFVGVAVSARFFVPTTAMIPGIVTGIVIPVAAVRRA